ncbi:MAG: ABC transporter permease [Candidatus Omnitrophica bacterium]|nr:ABC transporter permease [Candidatus Omnitrophota bacterium]
MLIFIKIAWRNIRRNFYRSVITISSIGIGFASLFFIRSFIDGADHQMVENYTGLISGHIQIHSKGFQDNPGLKKSIRSPLEVTGALVKASGITAVSPRVKEYVLISSAENSGGALLMGVDPEQEVNVTSLHKHIRSGKFVSTDGQIVIGKTLARSLSVGINDKIVVVAQAFDGSLASESYRICGLLDTGAEEMDKGLAIVTLRAADQLFVLDGKVSEFAVRAGSLEKTDKITASIKRSLDPLKYEVLSWKEISPSLLQWIQFDVAFSDFLLLVILLVVAAGILNTLLMGILERVREFGIMLALGTKRRQIVLMIGIESLILGLAGIAAGFALGAGSSGYFAVHGINLSSFSAALDEYYTGSVIYPRISYGYPVIYGTIVLITSLIVSIYPAWRAARLNPVEAIRG